VPPFLPKKCKKTQRGIAIGRETWYNENTNRVGAYASSVARTGSCRVDEREVPAVYALHPAVTYFCTLFTFVLGYDGELERGVFYAKKEGNCRNEGFDLGGTIGEEYAKPQGRITFTEGKS
jgi:hypothetical protein